MKTKRTSLNDIAKALNVSKATVSFVLNGKGDQFNISKEKQRLIQEKAREMSYVPNFFAKSLRQGETKTIGLVLPDISNPLYAEICKIVQERLYESGYNTFIVNSNDDLELEKELMRALIFRNIDGMIIAPSNNIKELIPILLETHIPVVFTDRPGDENADFVGLNNKVEGASIISHFSQKPKKVVALMPSSESVSTLLDRVEGMQAKCETENLPFEVVRLADDQEVINSQIAERINSGADSFIALNNDCTFKALSAFRANDVLYPDKVRLISFEYNKAFDYMQPKVSSLNMPVSEIARISVDRLYSRLKESKTPGEHFILSCDFLARESH